MTDPTEAEELEISIRIALAKGDAALEILGRLIEDLRRDGANIDSMKEYAQSVSSGFANDPGIRAALAAYRLGHMAGMASVQQARRDMLSDIRVRQRRTPPE